MEHKKQEDKNIPLVVDLDGTFINTDLLAEGIVLLLKKNFFCIFLCFSWIFKGKAFLKQKVFEKVQINYKNLPVNKELNDFLVSESQKGRKIVLATASPKSAATEIGKVFPVFDEIYGTEKDLNLKGSNKLELLADMYGKGGFDYIGNSRTDLILFASSRFSYLVNAGRFLERKTREVSTLKKSWKTKTSRFIAYLKLLRVYQWVKNLLIFLPLITSHSFQSVNTLTQVTLAFFAFCFVASAGYIVNDIMDLEADRTHASKHSRGLASGNIGILPGFLCAILLFAAGLIIGLNLKLSFFLILIVYFVLSIAYSVYLKKLVLYDVFILASFYTIRVVAGGAVGNIVLSFWLIAFSIFLFLSLSFIKRYSEFILTSVNQKHSRRDYSLADITLLQIMGIGTGLLSVIVFSLYINSPEVTLLYSNPRALWVICLLLLFWISRIWLVATRGKMTVDPIVFLLKDLTSYILIILTAVTLLISI